MAKTSCLYHLPLFQQQKGNKYKKQKLRNNNEKLAKFYFFDICFLDFSALFRNKNQVAQAARSWQDAITCI